MGRVGMEPDAVDYHRPRLDVDGTTHCLAPWYRQVCRLPGRESWKELGSTLVLFLETFMIAMA
jgi:hypothetical protein